MSVQLELKPLQFSYFSDFFRNAKNLHLNGAVARSIKLGKNDGLPVAERQFAVADRHGKRVAQHHCAEMGVGVLTIAFGKFWIVVPPVINAAYQPLKERFDVVEQRLLKFVDENCGSCMQRLHQDESGFQAVLAYHLVQILRDVDELQALARLVPHSLQEHR